MNRPVCQSGCDDEPAGGPAAASSRAKPTGAHTHTNRLGPSWRRTERVCANHRRYRYDCYYYSDFDSVNSIQSRRPRWIEMMRVGV
jgi:hypothetical protein